MLLARSILGADAPDVIGERIEAYCREHLGRSVVGCLGLTQSVGAVFTLVLEGGERVVLKAHGRDSSRLGAKATFESLVAVYGIQQALAIAGVPCPRVIHAPVRWEGGVIAAMEYLADGAFRDAHEPPVRRAMAESLADFVRRAEVFRDVPSLPVSAPPAGRLFPEPHNVLFDFATPGGEWIDERARRARAVAGTAQRSVVAHTDHSAANLRILGDRVSTLYDMDSTALVDEMRCLAGTAVHFTYNPNLGSWTWPSREEAISFAEATRAPAALRSRTTSARGSARGRSTRSPTPRDASTRSTRAGRSSRAASARRSGARLKMVTWVERPRRRSSRRRTRADDTTGAHGLRRRAPSPPMRSPREPSLSCDGEPHYWSDSHWVDFCDPTPEVPPRRSTAVSKVFRCGRPGTGPTSFHAERRVM